jgi:hypothetical protein
MKLNEKLKGIEAIFKFTSSNDSKEICLGFLVRTKMNEVRKNQKK